MESSFLTTQQVVVVVVGIMWNKINVKTKEERIGERDAKIFATMFTITTQSRQVCFVVR